MKNSTLKAPDGSYSFTIGDDSCLSLIVGPCVIESRDSILRHIDKIKNACDQFPHIKLVFKSSYDKANRTSAGSFRGLGIQDGLEVLAEVRKEFNVPIITDVHSPQDARLAAEVVDVLQIPAFLCRQTDLLLSVGSQNKVALIKKGQFLHPEDMLYAANKVESMGCSQILLCERGACFGYRDLIVDFRSFSIMRDLGYPVVFDATHSVQMMGGAHGSSSGNRKYVPALSRAALSYGVDALFIECHESPDQAPSDGPNMVPLDYLPKLLESLSKYWLLRKELADNDLLD